MGKNLKKIVFYLVRALAMVKPLAIALLEVPADGLDVAAVVAYGELLALGLE